MSRPLAIVTGARRGIGAGIALELAREGFDLALVDLGNEGAEAVIDAAQGQGANARLFVADLADVDGHDALVERIVTWGGPVAVLVNNAGVPAPQRGDLLQVTPEAFDQVSGVNLRGTFFLTQSVARHMAVSTCAHPRAIVTVSSVSAEMASIERGEYCLSKAALPMLTRLFSLRLASLGVGVYEVRPGIIRTPMTDRVAARYEERIRAGLVPMDRWGQPEDVAHAVVALTSGRLGFATGSVIQVDGGLSIPCL